MTSLPLPVVRTVADLRRTVREWHAAGLRVALVPTMGALHAGHLSLVTAGLARCDRVVVSIFVNPTQFGPSEDLSRYPRREAADAEMLRDAGAHLLYAPDVAVMYPPGFATTVTVSGITDVLCGPLRPGHFAGVATIVTKLLLQALPDVAVFGEKDYQQLQVVRRLVRDLDIPVEIQGAPTVRDEHGLALSSRNAYLSPPELETARKLNRVLSAVADRIAREPRRVTEAVAWGSAELRSLGFDRVEYLEARDAETLERLTVADRPARVLVAAYLGSTRLIDNMAVPIRPAT